MQDILDFSKPLNVPLFDQIVNEMFLGSGPKQQDAKNVLDQFQKHPDAWDRVDQIFSSSVMQSKYIALQILQQMIESKWKVASPENREGIKQFVISNILALSSVDGNKLLLTKLNLCLVQILKQEWPQSWPTFIPELCSSSQQNIQMCENSMSILKLFSEEIFDFSENQMTQAKIKSMKSQFCNEFSDVFHLCHQVLSQSSTQSLLLATLECLLKFLTWIPIGYVFETNLVDLLLPLIANQRTRNVVIKCMTEIAQLQSIDYGPKFLLLYQLVLEQVANIIPMTTNLSEIYDDSSDEDQQFIQNLGIFLSTCFSNHLRTLEENPEILVVGHKYLLMVSRVDDREVFKITLDYWTKLVSDLYDDNAVVTLNTSSSRKRQLIYSEVLSALRVVMIEAMVRPEEVLVAEEDGVVIRISLKESDTIILYKSMREVLVYLTHLDTKDTERIMTEKLERQMDGSEWAWINLSKLCWAIGSISGAFSEDTEKRFLVMVIKDLLSLVEMKRGKDNKAVVASNIMYVVGQYPRFLKAHWKFLKTVCNKLFEFMHELHEGVQDMACDTFMKIAIKCKRHFVIQQPNEKVPFIEEILSSIEFVSRDLTEAQQVTFYEAVAVLISAQPNKQIQERLIMKLMEIPNRSWDGIISQCAVNLGILSQVDTVKSLGHILRTNTSSCESIGNGFGCQMGRIFADLMGLYKYAGQVISQAVAAQGPVAAVTPIVRALRNVKKEILKLCEVYVRKVDDLQGVTNTMIPGLFPAVLADYNQSIDAAKDAQVLHMLAGVVTRLNTRINDQIQPIFDAVFVCTLNLIGNDYESNPEHRTGIFSLLQAINTNCFEALLKLSAHEFDQFMLAVKYGVEQPSRDVHEMSLSIYLDLISNFSKTDPAIANLFWAKYLVRVVVVMLDCLTSPIYKSGFQLQSLILYNLFQVIEKVEVPLYDVAVDGAGKSNKDYIASVIGETITVSFPHIQPVQIEQLLVGLYRYTSDATAFRSHLRDFIITMKEISGADNAEMYLEEKKQQMEEDREKEYQAALRIPGMVKPSQL